MGIPTKPAALLESPSDHLAWAHPLVRQWFLERFGSPTEPQIEGWPPILAGKHTLISAPTGSGKTLAAFLACIDRLVRRALDGDLEDRTHVLYVSPLKALGNDIQRNLEIPLGEIQALAGQQGLLMPAIRAAVRTGDTLMHERRALLKRPPHILVTTPESLYILLTTESGKRALRHVETVIVDEIHAVADDKRGTHLALSLERLDHATGRETIRIGLSATQKPIELVARFLTGSGRPQPVIVDTGHHRQFDLAVETPASELGPVASNEMWDEIYDRIVELARQHRSTLVFVNTRRLAERVAHHLAERMGEELVAAHHGSMSRKLRLEAERRLKEGALRVLVATASLELGIDVGSIDLVCHAGSPRSIAVMLQRAGRAGHWRGAIPKARIFATTRDELIECAALVRAIRQHDLDRLRIPEAPLDILAQQIVAACAADEWDEDELFALVRRAYPYQDLSRHEYERVLEMLSEGISARRGRYGAYLFRDQVNHRLRARRGVRLAAVTSGGAIPETALFTVVSMPEGTVVGTVDEDFAVESNAGDIMLLGNTSWMIRRVEAASGRMIVEDAHGAPPSVPFWRGEAPARTAELSEHVAAIRQMVSDLTPNLAPQPQQAQPQRLLGAPTGVERPGGGDRPPLSANPEARRALEWLKAECGLDDSAAEQLIEYVVAGRAVLGAVPTRQTVIAERFFDEGGGMQLVIHAPFGGRINKAWGLALRKRFCRSFNFELQAAATDNGINIALAEQHSFPLADVFHFLQPESVKEVLEQAVLTGSPVFQTRWRWDANRSLALLRFQGGKKVPPQIQRMRADDLLASVFPDVAACPENLEGEIRIPDHPLVSEVMKDALTEAMDIDGLTEVLRRIRAGEIRTVAVDTPVASQFSHEILNANPYAFLDDAPLEERRARAVQMRRTLPESVLREVGGLDPAAIEQVRDEAMPDVRDADDLHDLLQTLVIFPAHIAFAGWEKLAGKWEPELMSLIANRRAARVHLPPQQAQTERLPSAPANSGGREYWVASERAPEFRTLFPQARFEPEPPAIAKDGVVAEHALDRGLLGWLGHIGPITAAELHAALGLELREIETSLLRLEATGAILCGHFRNAASDADLEWCDRRLLARIHRLTVSRLRKQVEPVTPAQFMRWLLRWQHVAPGTQLSGERGLLEAIRQLQGFEIPASAWERQILARRVRDYDPETLDRLCLGDAVGWGRLSPHPATIEAFGEAHDPSASRASVNGAGNAAGETRRTRRVAPTSAAPITFFLREECEWMQPRQQSEEETKGLSPAADDVLRFLRRRGASFFPEIVRGTARLKAEVETGLWELVAAGYITADGFDNLRSLIDPRRRAGHGSGRWARPRHALGRWSPLHTTEPVERNHQVEAACWMLLRRYGVVFRELLARESGLPRWRELQVAMRRLEDRGEIRGGRFVAGFIGEQFALPVAVESLRELRRLCTPASAKTALAGDPGELSQGEHAVPETVTVSAADPLNLAGIIVPGERIPAISGRCLTLRDGVPGEEP
ncbi:MAG: DEAD/DEAH box helicase, partial [Candidatus Korobacteraceae bacterium]